MSPSSDPTELWTYAQIAEHTGITAGTLRVWRTRKKLPDPDFIIGEWPAWRPATVRQWWAESAALVAAE